MKNQKIWNRFALSIVLLCNTLVVTEAQEGLPKPLRDSISFAATFDQNLSADISRGDARLYSSKTIDRKELDNKLTTPGVTRLKAGARSGEALQFTKADARFLFYKVSKNVPYTPDKAWSGSISYFLRLDPEKDLPPNFVDPLHITEKGWNDAAFWNDFTKDDRPRKFRLGVLADLKVWNPGNKDFDKMPDSEKPAVVVLNPPFRSDEWTHILISFENFNTGQNNGTARLYINGKLQGEVAGRNQKFSWDPEKAVIFLGINYVGLMDDVMIFDRCLTADEASILAGFRHHNQPMIKP